MFAVLVESNLRKYAKLTKPFILFYKFKLRLKKIVSLIGARFERKDPSAGDRTSEAAGPLSSLDRREGGRSGLAQVQRLGRIRGGIVSGGPSRKCKVILPKQVEFQPQTVTTQFEIYIIVN